MGFSGNSPEALENSMRDANAASRPLWSGTPLARWMGASVLAVGAAVWVWPAHAQAPADPATGARAQPGSMSGHPAGHHPGGHHAGPRGPGGAEGPSTMLFGGSPERVARAVDHLLDGLNATQAQRTQIKQIATTAAADLKAQREAGRGLHAQGMQVFAAPTVDAAAAEAVRQQMSAQHEQASKRMLQAMLDVARVLTPEQRARVAARMKDREAAMRDRMQRMQQERPLRGEPRPGS